jgi:hypothetical protein
MRLWRGQGFRRLKIRCTLRVTDPATSTARIRTEDCEDLLCTLSQLPVHGEFHGGQGQPAHHDVPEYQIMGKPSHVHCRGEYLQARFRPEHVGRQEGGQVQPSQQVLIDFPVPFFGCHFRHRTKGLASHPEICQKRPKRVTPQHLKAGGIQKFLVGAEIHRLSNVGVLENQRHQALDGVGPWRDGGRGTEPDQLPGGFQYGGLDLDHPVDIGSVFKKVRLETLKIPKFSVDQLTTVPPRIQGEGNQDTGDDGNRLRTDPKPRHLLPLLRSLGHNAPTGLSPFLSAMT